MLNAPATTDAPLEKYFRRARAAGIHQTIVVSAFHRDYHEANAQVARIVARHPERLIGFAFVHARRDRGRLRTMIGQAVRQWGFRGVKVHGAEALPNREVCEAVRALGVPMLVDVTGRAEVMEMVAPQFPDVNFIVAHLGSFVDDWQAQQRVVDQLVRFPNVYADTSGVRRFDYLVQAVQRAGAKKLIFGTDGPWLHPGVELHKIRVLGLSRPDEALILGENVRRLMRLSNAPHHFTSTRTSVPAHTPPGA